ncbi:uncharacterized protein SPSK_07103 [Sporothrix schenckii 1099-18]|uniref:Zn(2)-C6 fungal-type domain-containing protein n=1 Tax=Sporothrix schenckii 1099-18 TaxID=1397361 RepID=A0A0F2MIX5_SPOSC|nr:uncharacterized protein SPSK_07103 [Sporothrix schenckii 1099-18]KJR88126.1 hypothetical protein SPSK_07103 [Sporothrix schenckii 1099-18]
MSSASAAPSKRIRLSLACNNCRKRKVRCDTETPKCRNCWLRDEDCETTDPRYPENGPTNVRRWATKDGLMPGQNPAATHRNQAQIPKHGPVQARSGADASTPMRHALSTSPAGTATSIGSIGSMGSMGSMNSIGSATADTVSWVSRGYQTSISSISAAGGRDTGIRANDNETETETETDADFAVNTESSTSHRIKYMGGSSVQCLSAFVNIYLRRKGLPSISSHFLGGMRHVEEFPLPFPLSLTTRLPPLPDPPALVACLDTYFTRIWPIYPVVDRAAVEADILFFQRADYVAPHAHTQLTQSHVPRLVIIFAIVAIGTEEAAGAPTELGSTFVTAAYSLLAHLVGTPYLSSVQALLLLAVALRCRCKEGQAWHVVAQAVRVAQSIGLHRQIRRRDQDGVAGAAGVDLHARVWWSCYALEKLMELETGRPSAITDDDIDQAVPSKETCDVFALWVALARILSQISRQLYRQKPASAWHLLSEIGALDQQLLAWEKGLPDADGITSPSQPHQPHQPHISSFLTLQYHQAQTTLLRASLVFPTQFFVDEVRRLGPRLPSYARLLQAENICTATARATIHRVLSDSEDGLERSHDAAATLLVSSTQLFLAAVVLALHIVKNPTKRLVRADLELLITATEHLELQFSRGGQHPAFVRGFETLRTSVAAAVSSSVEEEQRRSGAGGSGGAGPSKSTPPDPGPDLDAMHQGDRDPYVSGITPDFSLFGVGDDISMDELWGAIGTYSLLEPALDLDDPSLQPPPP